MSLMTQRLMIPRSFFRETCPKQRAVGVWLLAVAGLVFAMILVGGATRLTHSGLSIVEWEPVSGVVPPLKASDWKAEFLQYQDSPEYQLFNQGMSLESFKEIYWWEYAHRLLGRIVGLAFVLPLIVFLFRHSLTTALKGRLFFVLALGAMQGMAGWYMVQSGLAHEPAVSHYRLLLHFGLAVFLLSLLLWTAWDVLKAPVFARGEKRSLEIFSFAITGLLVLQLALGVLVAGLKAGYILNDWPWMGKRFVPEGLFALQPTWRNWFDNPVSVQFWHRLNGYFVLGLCMALVVVAHVRNLGTCVATSSWLLVGLALVQALWGVLALLYGVPASLGVLHQGFGVLLFVYSLYLSYAWRGRVHA